MSRANSTKKYFKCSECGRVKAVPGRQLKMSCCGTFHDIPATRGEYIDFQDKEKTLDKTKSETATKGAEAPAAPATPSSSPELTEKVLSSSPKTAPSDPLTETPGHAPKTNSDVTVDKVDLNPENAQAGEDIEPDPAKEQKFKCGSCGGETSNTSICDLCGVEFE